MPGKARRVASRQAQLGRRRKRQQSGQAAVSETKPLSETKSVEEADQQAATDIPTVLEPGGLEPGGLESGGPDSQAPESSVVDATSTPAPTERQSPRPSRPRRPSPVAARSADGELVVPARGGVRGRRERLSAQANIGAEVRRIVGMAVIVLAIIIVLGIVL